MNIRQSFLIVALLAGAVCAQAQPLPEIGYVYRTSASASPVTLSAGGNIMAPPAGIGASSTITFIVTNHSSQPLTLTRAIVSGDGFAGGTSGTIPMQPGESATVLITFAPVKGGPAAGTLTLAFTYPSGTTSAMFFLSGTALTPDVIASYIVNPSGNQTAARNGDTIRFTPANVGETTTATFILTNRGNGNGRLQSATVTGDTFRITGLPLLPADIGPDKEVRFTITFTPQTRATLRENLRVDVDGVSTILVLEGQGTGALFSYRLTSATGTAAVAENGSITLPSVNILSTSTARLMVTNSGNAMGRINTLAATGTAFALAEVPALPANIPPGGTFEFVVAFSPKQAGNQTGRLRIENANFDLNGTGIGPRLDFSATTDSGTVTLPDGTTLNFPNTSVGGRSSADVQIKNGGNAPASVNSIGLTGTGFQLTQQTALPVRLEPGEAITFQVAFTPETVGSLLGAVQIDESRIQLRGASTPPAALPAVTVNTSSDVSLPLQQPAVRVNFGTPYSLPVRGKLSLNFNSETFSDDPAIQFASGGRTVEFTIPENTTEAVFSDGSKQVQFQTGTVAGTISVSSTFTIASVNVTPNPLPVKTISIAQAEPQLTSVQATNRTPTGFDLIITGYSTSRSVTQLTFDFTATPGTTLQTPSLSQPVDAQFKTWYQNSASGAFGSQFAATVHMNGTGDLTTLQSVAVTATNGKGVSQPVSVNLR